MHELFSFDNNPMRRLFLQMRNLQPQRANREQCSSPLHSPTCQSSREVRFTLSTVLRKLSSLEPCAPARDCRLGGKYQRIYSFSKYLCSACGSCTLRGNFSEPNRQFPTLQWEETDNKQNKCTLYLHRIYLIDGVMSDGEE